MKNPIFLFLFWLRTNGLLLGCLLLCIARANTSHPLQALALGAVLIMLGSFPPLVALWAGTSLIALLRRNWPYRMYALLLLQTTICLVYTLFCLPLLFGYSSELWYAAAVLLACSYASSLYHLRSWHRFFFARACTGLLFFISTTILYTICQLIKHENVCHPARQPACGK
jgi:hypothetical protein